MQANNAPFILLLTSESINSLYQINCPVQTKFICSCVTVHCLNASVIKDIVLVNVLFRTDVCKQTTYRHIFLFNDVHMSMLVTSVYIINEGAGIIVSHIMSSVA